MKKITFSFLLATTAFTLGACSSNKETTSSSKETVASSTMEQPAQTNTKSENSAVVDALDKQFNADGDAVEIELQQDVVDSESNNPHEVIKIVVTDKETKDGVMEANDAKYSGDLTDDQKLLLFGIQQIVSDEAKNLKNDDDSIMFTYLDDVDNSMVVAYSTKTKEVIPFVAVDL